MISTILLLGPATAFAQSIFTVAGGGTDDGRPAIFAGLQPRGVALDASGDLYVVDQHNSRIRRIAAKSGIISTVAGNGSKGFAGDGGPATAAELFNPEGLTLDKEENLYIADGYNGRIRRVAAATGIITTVAGNGTGLLGDGGAAINAGLFFPSAVAIDAAGNLYITDTQNYRVRKVAAGGGIISTVAGTGTLGFSGDGGPATAAQFNFPHGISIDAAGNLYIVDARNHRIRKVDVKTGTVSTVAGSAKPGFSGDGSLATEAGLLLPYDVACDSAGNLYIADLGNNRIRKIAATTGIISTVAGMGSSGFSGDGGPAVSAALSVPDYVALDLAGNVYISDSDNGRVRRVDAASGIISTVAGNGNDAFSGDGGPATAAAMFPNSVALDARGDFYIADTNNNRIRKVAAATGMISTVAGNGSNRFSGDGGLATSAGIYSPTYVALDALGNLYITETSDNRIRKVAADSSIISTVAGNGTQAFSGDGGAAVSAGLYGPAGLALDAFGNLYIADSRANRVRKVAANTGIISTVVGSGNPNFSGDGGPATDAGLQSPLSVAVDPAGNLYVPDLGRIRKVAADSGIITTVAGNGTFEVSGDGGPATAAGILSPVAVALDRLGNIYIAEAYGVNRIRKVAVENGLISSVAGNGSAGSTGDGGPARAAGFDFPIALALDANDTLYIADPLSARVRAVFACVSLTSSALLQPANGSSAEKLSPKLAWSAVKSVFHYDVYLDTVNPPLTIVAAGLTVPTYSPSNLQPLTKYYWKVVAKGDPFCTPFSSASSQVWSFTTTGTCSAPGSFAASNPIPGGPL